MKIKIGSLTKIKTGKLDANASSEEGQYPFFTCSKEPLRISTYSYDCECVLVAGNGDLNVKYYDGKFDAYQRTYIIEDNGSGKLYMPYLYYFMEDYIKELRKQAIGGVIKYIKLGNLTEALIELPSVHEQKAIVKILEKTKNIIDMRKREIENLDNIVKARFVELFGVYPANTMGWEIGTIRDVVTEVRYGSSRPATNGGKYPYLRMNNITYGGELDLSDTKCIDIPDNELDKCTVRRGDVLFNRTNSKELVGKTCVYNRDEMMVLAGFVIRIRVKDCILPEFLSAFLNTDFSKKMLLGMCKTAIGQANINAQELQNIGLYLPPVELQRRFVLFKKETEKSKVTPLKATKNRKNTLKRQLRHYNSTTHHTQGGFPA